MNFKACTPFYLNFYKQATVKSEVTFSTRRSYTQHFCAITAGSSLKGAKGGFSLSEILGFQKLKTRRNIKSPHPDFKT